jgi:hypothetical protein
MAKYFIFLTYSMYSIGNKNTTSAMKIITFLKLICTQNGLKYCHSTTDASYTELIWLVVTDVECQHRPLFKNFWHNILNFQGIDRTFWQYTASNGVLIRTEINLYLRNKVLVSYAYRC